MSTSTAISSAEFIPLPPAAPQIRRRVSESKTAGRSASVGIQRFGISVLRVSDTSIDGVRQFDFVDFRCQSQYLAHVIAENGKEFQRPIVQQEDGRVADQKRKPRAQNLHPADPPPGKPRRASPEAALLGTRRRSLRARVAAKLRDKCRVTPSLRRSPLLSFNRSPTSCLRTVTRRRPSTTSRASSWTRWERRSRRRTPIIPHFAAMQSLLSKKGANHNLVIEALKQDYKIPWWTDFYKGYKDRLWESLRTMERRIAAYRSEPTAQTSKPERDTDPVPRLNNADRKALIEGNHRANELAGALEAGCDGRNGNRQF